MKNLLKISFAVLAFVLSFAFSNSTSAQGTLATPTNVTISNINATSFMVSCNPVDGANIYVVLINGIPVHTNGTGIYTATAQSTSQVIYGLQPGITYSVTLFVMYQNPIGTRPLAMSSPSSPVSVTTTKGDNPFLFLTDVYSHPVSNNGYPGEIDWQVTAKLSSQAPYSIANYSHIQWYVNNYPVYDNNWYSLPTMPLSRQFNFTLVNGMSINGQWNFYRGPSTGFTIKASAVWGDGRTCWTESVTIPIQN